MNSFLIDKNKASSTLGYSTREQRMEYVWLMYNNILKGKTILDVGSDECHLKKHLGNESTYWGIGIGGSPDQDFDLESGPLPFPDKSYDVVLCLQVLEHLENIHFVFDELCRVSRRHVIISLPNCLRYLWLLITKYGMETPDRLMKYYGLPLVKPEDRHRWFFDSIDAERFIRYRAELNQMKVSRLHFSNPLPKPRLRKRIFINIAMRFLFREDIDRKRLSLGSLWALLEKQER